MVCQMGKKLTKGFLLENFRFKSQGQECCSNSRLHFTHMRVKSGSYFSEDFGVQLKSDNGTKLIIPPLCSTSQNKICPENNPNFTIKREKCVSEFADTVSRVVIGQLYAFFARAREFGFHPTNYSECVDMDLYCLVPDMTYMFGRSLVWFAL